MDVDSLTGDVGTRVYLYSTFTGNANQRFNIYFYNGRYFIEPAYGNYHLDLSRTTLQLEIWGDYFNVNGPQDFDLVPIVSLTVLPGEGSGDVIVESMPKEYEYVFPECTFTPPDGYVFSSWTISDESYIPGETYIINNDATVYATWVKEQNNITITYDANGGISAPAPQTYSSNNCLITDGIPKRNHYWFRGWANLPTATDAMYEPGKSYQFEEDAVLYAVWEHRTDRVLQLPESLTEIADDAFSNIAADVIIVPSSVQTIAANAFDKDVALQGHIGSYAQEFAEKHGLLFYPME